MRDFFMRRYGRIFPVVQTADGQIIHVGDTIRINDDSDPRTAVCFFYSDHDELAVGFTPPEGYNPLAPMWQQEALLKDCEKV